MKTRKTMLERIKAYHKKHGGFVTVIKLSEMLWKYMSVLNNSDCTTYGTPKRVRVPRTAHTYRLKSARGRYSIRRLAENGAWILRHCDTYLIPRVTCNPLRDYAALHMTDREVCGK